jgi:hypothetical protein
MAAEACGGDDARALPEIALPIRLARSGVVQGRQEAAARRSAPRGRLGSQGAEASSLSCHRLLGKVAYLVFEGFPAMAR